MKIRRFLMTIAATVATMAAVAKTDGFSYQAVVRNAQNELVSNTKVGLRLTLTDQTGTPVFYQETQSGVATNAYGVLSVTVGNGTPVGNNELSTVDWTKDVFLKVEVDVNNGTNYTNMGATKIQAVPVALYAARSGSSSQGSGEQNGGAAAIDGDALFEVKDKDGNLVFAVYPEGVHVYIDPDAEGSKLRRSGFLVTGREATKDGVNSDYFAVNSDGTQVYVGEGDDKLRRSGFLVTGREATKEGVNNNYFAVNDDGTQVYVGEGDDKLRRSGFLVTGREATKEGVNNNYFAVNDDGTQVFVGEGDDKLRRSGFLVTGREATKEGVNNNYLSVGDDGTKVFIDDQLESDAKLRRSGFLVTGREATKDGNSTNYMKVATDGTQVKFDADASKLRRSGFLVTGREATKGGVDEDYMTINTDSTRFYINGGSGAKGNFGVDGRDGGAKDGDAIGGFAVSGRDGSKGKATNNLFNIDLATDAKTLKGENRVYWYPEKNAFMAGNLKVSNAAQVGTNSFNAGYQNIASGNYSQAMGYMSTAKGDYSTAIGRKANAGALRAFALGDSAQAIGRGSYALGDGAVASGMNSYAFGGGFNALFYGERLIFKPARAINDFAYAIGPGTLASGKGSVAIGVGDTASYDNSTAIGFESKADWASATAIGYQAKSSSMYSVAIGAGAIVKKGCAHGFAIGNEAICEAGTAVAIGTRTKATGSQSTAIGIYANSIGPASIALGPFTKSEGMCSTAIGEMTRAIGENSTAMGIRTRAYSYGETVVGFDNTEYTPEEQNDDGEEPATNRLFVVGNGRYEYEYTYDEETDEEHEWDTICYSDALIIYKNGDAEFRGNIYPSAEKNVWTEATSYTLGTSSNLWNKVYASNGTIQTSDQRLKTNIKPLERALNKVLTLNGVTYEWRVKEFPNRHFDSNRHVGVLAQELEAVLPEAVETGEDGYKSVNYSEITPLLIEAVKELKTIIDGQNKKIEELEKQIEELKK